MKNNGLNCISLKLICETISKMNVLIILGHPNNKSFNHSIANTCKKELEANGHSVFFHDLYAENFNPVHHIETTNSEKDIKLHFSHLASCDAIIVIHPNWWGQPPAIIKGWIDRVLVPGVAYDFVLNDKGDYIPIGLLKATIGLVLNTSNTPNNDNDILDTIWKNNIFKICGVNNVERINFGLVKNSSETQRYKWLIEVEQLVNSLFPINK